MAQNEKFGDGELLERALDKGYLGGDPSPAAQAETREADQTQGGPVLTDEDRSPVSGERTDADENGTPLDTPEAEAGGKPSKSSKSGK